MGKDEDFYACLYYIKQSEGGDSNDKNDKGGKTRTGVTQAQYDQYIKEKSKKQGNTSNQTYRSVFTLTTEEIDDFYYSWYKKYNIDKIQDLNTRYIYFDATIHHGPGKAAQLAQKTCNIKVDGAFGKKSIEAVNSMNQQEFQKKFNEQRKRHYNNIVANDPTQNKFLKGWINRVNKTQELIEKRALDLGIRNKQDQTPQTNSKINQFNNQQPQNPGGIDCNVDIRLLNSIKGVNQMSGRFLIESQENIALSDLATVLLVFNDPQLKNEHKRISFSLDPIILPNQNEFKQQEKVCWPDTLVKRSIIQDTEFAQILFESDYLLKLMSLGVKADGQTPFDYPQELKDLGLNSIGSMETNRQQQMLCRFWLVPQQCFYAYKDNKYVIEDIKVICQARQLERINDKLQDKICQDIHDSAYQFATKFTESYDKIAKYYPIFNRLKQLFKAVALGRWMYENQVKLNYQELIRYSKRVNNNPKSIPILKYEQKGEENKTPIYFTYQEKIQTAKDFLIEKGHPTTQDLINQVVQQIPDIKGYSISQRVKYSQGGVDTHCQNMIESNVNPKMNKYKDLEEVDIPFFPQKKCTQCNRMIENHLLNLDQNQCSVHNQYTCYLCLELITKEESNPKCSIINNYKYIFHQDCYKDYEDLIQSQQYDNEY